MYTESFLASVAHRYSTAVKLAASQPNTLESRRSTTHVRLKLSIAGNGQNSRKSDLKFYIMVSEAPLVYKILRSQTKLRSKDTDEVVHAVLLVLRDALRDPCDVSHLL
jgi:hypothetical protein